MDNTQLHVQRVAVTPRDGCNRVLATSHCSQNAPRRNRPTSGHLRPHSWIQGAPHTGSGVEDSGTPDRDHLWSAQGVCDNPFTPSDNANTLSYRAAQQENYQGNHGNRDLKCQSLIDAIPSPFSQLDRRQDITGYTCDVDSGSGIKRDVRGHIHCGTRSLTYKSAAHPQNGCTRPPYHSPPAGPARSGSAKDDNSLCVDQNVNPIHGDWHGKTESMDSGYLSAHSNCGSSFSLIGSRSGYPLEAWDPVQPVRRHHLDTGSPDAYRTGSCVVSPGQGSQLEAKHGGKTCGPRGVRPCPPPPLRRTPGVLHRRDGSRHFPPPAGRPCSSGGSMESSALHPSIVRSQTDQSIPQRSSWYHQPSVTRSVTCPEVPISRGLTDKDQHCCDPQQPSLSVSGSACDRSVLQVDSHIVASDVFPPQYEARYTHSYESRGDTPATTPAPTLTPTNDEPPGCGSTRVSFMSRGVLDYSQTRSGLQRTVDKCEDHCIQAVHPSLIWADQSDWESIIKVQYTGSFSVIGEDQTARAEYVRKQLVEMRNVTKTKPVLLVISLSGIKVCSNSGESVYMAHALKRISYATCDPEFCQFSFLAREPKGHTSIQYCHSFITTCSDEAEELNAIVANAFKMAYTHQRQRQEVEQTSSDPAATTSSPSTTPQRPSSAVQLRQPTFNELIEQQIEDQREKFDECARQQQEALEKRLSLISTAKIDERVRERRERRKKELEEVERERELQRLQGKDRTSWAKHIAGKAHHRSPYVDESPKCGSDLESSSTVAVDTSHKCESVGDDAVAMTSANTNQNSNLSPFSSISALRDAFNSGELRSYGSPVMTLKETIDRIQISPSSGQLNFTRANDPTITVTTGELSPLRRDKNGMADRHLNPAMSTPNISRSSTQMEDSPDFAQRPLPSTPESRKRSKGKGHKSSRKSGSPANHHPDTSPLDGPPGQRSSTGSMLVLSQNGYGCHDNQQRPLSGRYQNDSPMHSRSGSEPEDVDMYQGPPTPLRYDSLKKVEQSDTLLEQELKSAPWYQAGIPREIALEILGQEEIGSFIVRDSTSHPSCFALSVKVPKFDNPSGISHYLIMRTPRGGVKLKGLDKEWTSLTALVTHHTVMPEMLPCTLHLPRNSSNLAFKETDNDNREDDEDYQRLSDFNVMMADLKM